MNKIGLEKKVQIVSGLAEGSSIRSLERITGVHRDTIMRLGVRVGQGCSRVLDEVSRGVKSKTIEIDELWGYIGKKQKNTQEGEVEQGDIWTFVAIDTDTKFVPSFAVGKRDGATADAFLADLHSRLNGRVQLTSDKLDAYVEAVEKHFGDDVDYAQMVKRYKSHKSGKYSPAQIVSCHKQRVSGHPNEKKIGTSYVERQNLTVRMHCRRLTRLTNAFSKKLENFKTAIALNFAYYNLVRIHSAVRMTPALAAGVTDKLWTVRDLLEAAGE